MQKRWIAAALTLALCAACEENKPAQSAQDNQPPPENQPQGQQSMQQGQGQQGQGMQGQGMQGQGMQGQGMQNQGMNQQGQGSMQGSTQDQGMQGQHGAYGQDQSAQGMQNEQQQTQQQPTTDMMSDEQILVLANVVSTGEIDEAKLAQQKAKDPRVKHYAAMMIQDHTLAREQEQRIITRLKLKPQESERSRQMESENRQTMDRLRTLSGTNFDRQYLADQVKEHSDFLQLIDTKIMPSIKTQELKTHFEGLRPKIARHLAEAQNLQRQIGTAPVSER